MLGTLRNIIDRFDHTPGRTRHSAGHHHPPAPVAAVLDSPALVDEVALAVAVTGRELLDWDPGTDLPGDSPTVILITEPDRDRGKLDRLVTGLITQGVTPRTVTVTDDPTATGPGPLFLLPREAPEFAEHLGVTDLPDLAVFGPVGGAGTSTFAAVLAGACARAVGEGPALLVDEEGEGRMDTVLGLENEPGLRAPDLAGTPVVTADQLVNLPVTGDVRVITGTGHPLPVLRAGCPVVRDCGRWSSPARARLRSRPVLVVPATVPGVLAGRSVLAQVPGALVVLREIPRSELGWNDALTLLGRSPDVTWEDDPFITGETDLGRFAPTPADSGTAADAADELMATLW